MVCAICFKCGEQKTEPLGPCKSCGVTPGTASDRTVSLALSTYIASEAQLSAYTAEIARGAKPSIPMGDLSIAIEGVKNGLGTAPSGVSAAADGGSSDSGLPYQAATQATGGAGGSKNDTAWEPFGTSIDDVPFAVLGATSRDGRKRIVELADERSLISDPAACQKARSDLTNPRMRLSAELAWFPGLSPGKIARYISALHNDPRAIRDEAGLPPLAHFNLMVYAMELVKTRDSDDDIAAFLCEAADLAEEVDPDSVLRDINEDRGIAGFPAVQTAEQVESALAERKARCREVVKHVLNRLPSTALVNVLTVAVDTATDSGDVPAPKLLDDLVDNYAAEVRTTLDVGAARIRQLVEAVKSSAESGAGAVDAEIAQLEVATKKWDTIAQPIQMSAKARGVDDQLSHELAIDIRSLAIDLFNDHDLLTQAQRIAGLLTDVFAELPGIVERVGQDTDTLNEIAEDRKRVSEKFKDFNLSGDIFSWKNSNYDIRKISHIGFYRSITTHKTNFVETGKTEKAVLTLIFNANQSINMSIDEQGILWNKNRRRQIQLLADFYGFLMRVTFDRRLKFYEDQIESHGYFNYDECFFYPHKKIVFRGRDFDIKTYDFLRSYGIIEIRKKDYGFLDRVKREVSLTKIPQFTTVTDTDIIFHLLDKYMGLRWNNQ